MSNSVFPVLPGLAWNVIKTPQWSTRIQKSVSGREIRAAYYSIPLWSFTLTYDVLRAGVYQELQTMIGFFNARQGSYDSFLYKDPTDNTVTSQQFGTGNGSQLVFQLVRTMGGYTEPILAIQSVVSIFKAGVLQSSGVTVDFNTGKATFSTPPANGAALVWSGVFYYRCRFLYDSIDFDNFMYNLWQAKKIEFVSIK